LTKRLLFSLCSGKRGGVLGERAVLVTWSFVSEGLAAHQSRGRLVKAEAPARAAKRGKIRCFQAGNSSVWDGRGWERPLLCSVPIKEKEVPTSVEYRRERHGPHQEKTMSSQKDWRKVGGGRDRSIYASSTVSKGRKPPWYINRARKNSPESPWREFLLRGKPSSPAKEGKQPSLPYKAEKRSSG